MTGPDDDFVRDALEDAVSDVEPTDRLVAIRCRTTRRPHRSWSVPGGAVLAAAAVVAVVAAVAVVTTGGDTDRMPDVAASTSPTATPAPAPARAPTDDSPVVDPPAQTTPVYYVGPGADGPGADTLALYRYFEPAGDPLELLMSTPSDPDYQTLWPQGYLESYEVADDRITVDVGGVPADPLALQQLIYTLHAVTRTTLPIRLSSRALLLDDRPVPAEPLDVLSHVSISDPGERYAYSGSFTARGVGNGYEGTIACRLVDEGGTEAWSGATVAGAGNDLAPWELDVDLAGLSQGRYVLICQNDDPTGGTEGVGTFADDRTVYVTAPEVRATDPTRG